MALTTSLAGRVRNTSLPKSHALLPLHEAIVNGIQAIDARPDGIVGPGRIDVRVHRDPQAELDFGWAGPGRAPTKPMVGFTVTDDGVGFTARNVLSFETLDSDFKSDLGCRGVGRLLWLKAFDRVSVRSGYEDDQGEFRERQFTFSVERGRARRRTERVRAPRFGRQNRRSQEGIPAARAERRGRHRTRSVPALHLEFTPSRRCSRSDHRGRR